MGRQFNDEEIIEAIKACHGLLTIAAKRLGCSHTVIYNRVKTVTLVADAVTEAREEMLDFTESKLFTAIDKGDVHMIKFYLATQGKSRGYIERQELTGADGKPVVQTNNVKLNFEGVSKEILEALASKR